MEFLLKQTRTRFFGAGEGSKERKIPPQKTETFKGERKGLRWVWRQMTSRMNEQSNDPEYATAVAAAAYAIKSLEETKITDQKKKKKGEPPPEPAPTRAISKREGISSAIPGSGRFSGASPIEISEPGIPLPPPPPARKTQSEKPAVAPASTLKRIPTGIKQDIAVPKPPPPPPPPSPPPPPWAVKEPATGKAQTKRGRPIGEIEIDAWEKAEMAKIKEKHDKVISEIVSWADKKKSKAKRKLDKTEGALDQKRAKAMHRYRTEIQNIDYVANGAKAKAEEKRRNEELKVKDKANIIKQTGEFPPTCSCF